MDYHSLPRRQLQVLCKKHGIPANAANSEMAEALTSLFKPKPQPHTHKSKQPEKRATRSSEPAMSETNSKNNDVEEGLNLKPHKGTDSQNNLEQDLNREPQRSTRGRGSAIAATSKMAKMPTAGEMETNAATKQQGTKKVCTRNGGSKESVSELTHNAKEKVDSKTLSPSDKKREKSGGIVLRRGRVKVRSPRNLSNSPESAQLTEEMIVRTKKNGVGMPSSQSCLVDARRTRKKKRSVTFSDVIEINSVSIESSAEVEASNEAAEEAMAEIQQGVQSGMPKNKDSASMAKKTINTRKTSRSFSTDVIAAQAEHQKIKEEPVAKVSKAKESGALMAEKNASIEVTDRKRPVRGKKTVDSAGQAAAKENRKAVNFVSDAPAKEKKKTVNSVVGDAVAKESKELADVDAFVSGHLIDIEPAPCVRRSRRLTIVPTDVISNHNLQLATEQLKCQSKNDHEDVSSKRSEGDFPAETSRRGRRKTLGPLELNHVQTAVESVPQQMEQKVSKAKITQSKSFTYESKDEALKLKQKQPDMKTCNKISAASEAGIQPNKSEEGSSVRNVCGSTQKASVTKMGNQKVCCTEIISGSLPENMQAIVSDETHSKAAQSASIFANSEPDSLQEVLKDAKANGEVAKTTCVKSKSAIKTSDVSAQQPKETLISQKPAFSTQEQEIIEILDEDEEKELGDSEDFDVVVQAHYEQSQEVVVLESTNVSKVDDTSPTGRTTSKEEINNRESFSCAIQIVIGEATDEKNRNFEDADLNTSMAAIHSMAGDSNMASTTPLEDTHSVRPDGGTAAEDQEFTDGMSSATSPEHVLSRRDFIIEKNEVIEREYYALDDSAAIIRSTHDIKDTLSHSPPVDEQVLDEGIPDGKAHLHAIISENTIENCSNISSSASATVESVTEIFLDTATAEHKASTFEVHHLSSDKIGSMTSESAADSTEQQPTQVVESNLCERKEAVEDDRSTGDDQSRELSPILPLCSEKPKVTTTPMESACKKKQRRPRSIFKSARKAQSSVSWESTNLEATTALHSEKEASLDPLDEVEKNAGFWDLNNQGMTKGGIDSASSENEGSSADTEETLSDTEDCNFEPNMLVLNTEGEHSCREDDTPSDSEEDAMFESDESFSEVEEELVSGDESEEQETSEEELSESEDDEEDEYENDEEDEYEEYKASSVSQQPVALSESIDALYSLGVLEDRQAEIMAVSKSSLSNYVVRQTEIANHVVFEHASDGCAPDAEPTDNDENFGAQHVDFPQHVVTVIQRNEDVLMALNDDTSIEEMQSARNDSECLASLSSLFASPTTKVQDQARCSFTPVGMLGSKTSQQSQALETEFSILPETVIQRNEDLLMALNDDTSIEEMQSAGNDSECLASLSSLFASPTTKVQDQARCSFTPVGMLGSKTSQQSQALETEFSILSESVQEKIVQSSSPCELSHEEVVTEVGQPHIDVAEHETELCDLVDAAEKQLETNDQMADVAKICCVEELQEPFSPRTATRTQENADVLISYNDTKAMEVVQSPICSLYQNRDYLTPLSSLFASPPSKLVKEDAICSLTPPSMTILESNFSQQSRVLETETNLSPESREESFSFPCEVSQHNVEDHLEQHTLDGTNQSDDLCKSLGDVEKELEVKAQKIELIENYSVPNSGASSPTLNYAEQFQVLDLNIKNEFMSSEEREQVHSAATEVPCLGPYGPTPETNQTEMGNSIISEEEIQNSHEGQKVQEEMEQVLSTAIESTCLGLYELTPENSEAEMGESAISKEVIENLNNIQNVREETEQVHSAATELISLDLYEPTPDNNEAEKGDSILCEKEVIENFGNVQEVQEETEQVHSAATELPSLGPYEPTPAITPQSNEAGKGNSVFCEEEVIENFDNVQKVQEKTEQFHSAATEVPCLGPYEPTPKNNESAMGDLGVFEEEFQQLKNVQKVEEEPGNLKINEETLSHSVDEDEIKSDPENSQVSVGMVSDAQNSSEDLEEQLELAKGTSTEQLLLTEVPTFGSLSPAENELSHKQNNEDVLEFDTAYTALGTKSSIASIESAKDETHMLSAGSSYNLFEQREPLVQHECGLDLLTSDASKQLGLEIVQPESILEEFTSQVVISDAFEVDLCRTPKETSSSEIALMVEHESPNGGTQTVHCAEIECMNAQVELVHEKSLDESEAFEGYTEDKDRAESEAIGVEPDSVQSDSNVDSFVSQVANDSFEDVELCSTPKQSDLSEFASVLTHESLNKVVQTMDSAEIESVIAQKGEVHEKLMDEGQSSEDCKEDKEFPAKQDLVHEITKEQSLKQIDLTLLSVRQLREMCKGNLMSSKKKEENEAKRETENATPAKMPTRPWMSATKPVHRPNTSMHQRDLPSANKRSALKALSSNIKAAPSAAMQTPTAKGSQRPQNLMSVYDGNDGTGKHLITPSPHAPMSSKRDFARSHHR